MKVTTETVATREVALTIEPDPDRIQQAMRKAARQISRWRPVPGFRPGKAPYAMVERIFGREVILDEALNDIANDLYREAIREAGIEPYQQGQFKVESQDPVVLKVNVPLAPSVTLGDYHALHIDPEPEVSVTEAQIDEQIEQLRRRHAEYVPVERPVQMGDQVVAKLVGVSEGETVIDQENATLNIQDQLPPPGFAEALLGMTADETRQFTLTYPDDYEDTNLAGKNVDFTVTIKTIRQVNLPEVNDDLAKMAGDFETLAVLRENLATNLKQRLEAEARNRETNAAIEALVAQSTVEYPAVALDQEIHALLDQQRSRIQSLGFTWENYLRMIGRTEQDLHEDVRPEAERRLVQRLVLNEFARAEKLTVSQEELTSQVNAIAASYGERANEALEQLRNSNAILSIYADALTRKAARRLTALLTGREAQAEEVEQGVAEEPEEAAEGSAEPAASEASQPEGEQSTEGQD